MRSAGPFQAGMKQQETGLLFFHYAPVKRCVKEPRPTILFGINYVIGLSFIKKTARGDVYIAQWLKRSEFQSEEPAVRSPGGAG